MTELPRYIGRHASPKAAAPSAGEPAPEAAATEDDMARDDDAGYDEDDMTPAAEPAMPRLEFDPSGAEEPTTIIDPRPGPYPQGPHRPGPPSRSIPPRSPGPPGPPGGSAGDPTEAPDTWTAPAPDIPSGPAPEAVELPEPEPELTTEVDAGLDDDPGSDDGPESPSGEAEGPDPPAEYEIDLGPEPIPQPEAEPDMPLRSESDWSPTPVFPPSGASPVRPVPTVSDVDSHGLARIALLDAVKEIWPGGTPDLSVWLAAHLELLEDPLGFSLTPRHHAPAAVGQVVDDYDADQSPLDIPGNLLTADLGGAAVVVRAQAYDADTEGLGALLGAAAAAQAQTAVWVCPRIDPSLRQALRWVGGDPSANVRLYGLEMYLVQIAGSPTAPLFDAVVSPGAP